MLLRPRLARTLLRLSRWQAVGRVPESGILVGAPHTSNWDWVAMLLLTWRDGVQARVLVKRELFRGPLAPLLRATGGVPLDRANPGETVRAMLEQAGRDDRFLLVLAAEGTRGRADHWKSGFYRMAQQTGLPVTLGFVDGPTRTMGFGPTFHPSGDVVADMDRVRAFYADKHGINPALRTEPRLREEAAARLPSTDAYFGDPAVAAEWDRRYTEQDRLWSGRPNGALVTEVAGLEPGRALDVGCGEGADAVWLAGQGWDVTALEVSGVALERAAGHARDAGATVRWVHAGLAEAALPPRSYDLVSAQYPALLRTPGAAAERALLDAVAPGGVLLLVHHAGMDTRAPEDGGFDAADYVWPSMVAALLDDDWVVERDEQRPRTVPAGGAGAHHTDDVVLRARRLR